MTKNIEDLLYRGDSLERMGDMSSRLREDSRKYRKAAVRINWELLLKQVSLSNALKDKAYMCDTVRPNRSCSAHYYCIYMVALLLSGTYFVV